MGDNTPPQQRKFSISSYLTWFFSHHKLFFRNPPLTSMKGGAVVKISATADGQDHEVVMPRNKCDTVIAASIICKRNADESGGTIDAVTLQEPLKDSDGRIYQPQNAITLRCVVNDAAQSFSERFYIVDECGEFDTLLRKGAGSDLP